MRVSVLVLLAMVGAWGCARTNLEVQARRLSDGRIRYVGSLAGPYDGFRKMTESVCETLSAQPGVTSGLQPKGYCAPYFYSPEDHAFFVSGFADAEGTLDSPEKACTFSRSPLGGSDRSTLLLGGTYSTTTQQSQAAASAGARIPWQPTLFSDQESREPWSQDVLVFLLEGNGRCSVYEYNALSRRVSVRHGNAWRPFAEVSSAPGFVRVLENGQ